MVHLGVTTVDRTDCVPIFRSYRLCLSTRELRTEQGRELLVQDFEPYKRLIPCPEPGSYPFSS